MSIFKQHIDSDRKQRDARLAAVSGRRNQVQGWIGDHLSQIHAAAGETGGQLYFRTFNTLIGGTTQDVDLVGTMHEGAGHRPPPSFDVGISWRAADHENVTFYAGQTRHILRVEEALDRSPVNRIADALESELSRSRDKGA